MRSFVSGATGYVGSRLIPELLNRGASVVAGMREPQRAKDFSWGENVQAVKFDLEDRASVENALAGVDVAYYLVHSMAGKDFKEKDARGARTFSAAAEKAGVSQIVYLSGLIPTGELSEHLASRLEVEQILLNGPTPTRVIRAAIVLGAGSTSFEIVRRLVERLPLIPIPRWMTKKVQPVATEDVIGALADSLRHAKPVNSHEDLGGPDVLSYPAFIHLVATEMGLHRRQIRIPFIPDVVVGNVVSLITKVPRNTCVELIKSLRHDMICSDPATETTRQLLSVQAATKRSLNTDHTGTSLGGDIQSAAASDPEWTGGDIEFKVPSRRFGRRRPAA